MAEWLNTTFSAFDSTIIYGISTLQCGFLTVFFKVLSSFFERGIVLFALGITLMLFKKTRKFGVTLFGAVAFSAFFSNILLKYTIERIRPMFDERFSSIWQAIGSPIEEGFSFPSGHAASLMAGATTLFVCCNKKWSFLGFVLALIVGVARIYLVAHYPTDVIAGFVFGAISMFIAQFIVMLIYKISEKNKDKKLFDLWLNFDIIDLFKKDKKIEKNN